MGNRFIKTPTRPLLKLLVQIVAAGSVGPQEVVRGHVGDLGLRECFVIQLILEIRVKSYSMV